MGYTSEEIVRKDAESIYIGNINTVEFDLKLPTKGQLGSDITWVSGHERFLSSTGKVERPKYGMNDRTIALDAILTFGEATFTRRFMVKVLQMPNNLKVQAVEPVYLTACVGKMCSLPGAAIVTKDNGDVISHMVEWEAETFCFEQAGEFEVTGQLTDTEIPVTGKISVRDSSDEASESERRGFIEASQVVFAEGPFLTSVNRMRDHLLTLDDDQMLYNHRFASGVDVRGAMPMEGWDSPDSQIKGHTTGHYLSALALCYRATKDEKIYQKASYMVEALRECQAAFEKIPGIKAGFLAGYSEKPFDQLEEYTPYPENWCPYYNMHKLLAGLLDLYEYAGFTGALEIAKKLGSWIYHRLSRLPKRQLTKMWSMYIAGEFGGMNEVLARLCRLTGDDAYLVCAKYFDNDKLFYPLSQYADALSGMHGNQHIPQILGGLEIYKATGEEKYLRIAKQFWESVTEAHIYVNGGVGEGEMFHPRNQIGSLLTSNTTESCASYNMLKLTKELYKLDPKPEYMDYYERVTMNHILANQDEKGSGNTTYFFPLKPGGRREFLVENHCCHGTGLESPFRYQDGMAFLEELEDGCCDLHMTLYTPCEITFAKEDIHVRVENVATEPDKFFLHVIAEGKKLHAVKIRMPYWAQMGDNDSSVAVRKEGESDWNCQGQTNHLEVWAELAYSFRIERPVDRPELGVICYGPYVLAILDDGEDFLELPGLVEDLEQKIQVHSLESFEYEGYKLCPLYLVGDRAYHTYVRI